MGPPCRLCESSRLLTVLDLGATPPCEKFLSADELDLPETTFPLRLLLCQDCLLLQIPAMITPEDTFTEYAYFSSFSDSWVRHAKAFVEETVDRLELGKTSLVVEVASNDGYLLQHVVQKGIPCVGVEPSVNVGAAPANAVCGTETAFLDEESAAKVATEYGQADLVIANNVYAHIPDLTGFTRSLRTLLADEGWLSIEVHHALNLVGLAQFDTVYHEHCWKGGPSSAPAGPCPCPPVPGPMRRSPGGTFSSTTPRTTGTTPPPTPWTIPPSPRRSSHCSRSKSRVCRTSRTTPAASTA